MSEVQRYDYEAEWPGALEEYDQGGWVQYDDHAASLAAKDAEIERLRGVLATMANDGCDGSGTLTHGETCLTDQPDDRTEWCWSCVAAEALNPEKDQ